MITRILLLAYVCALQGLLAARGHRGRTAPTTRTNAAPIRRVLIVGASGGTGRELVAQALARGLSVRALVRRPESLALQHPQLEIVSGDVLDPAAVARAVADQDAVLSALGHRRFWLGGDTLSRGTRHLLEAMAQAPVQRFICETSAGLGGSVGRLGLYYTLFVIPVILPLYFLDKCRQERAIAASPVPWVLVRPGALTDGPRIGQPRTDSHWLDYLLTRRISRADVAAFMLDQLTGVDNLGMAVTLMGHHRRSS
jgi:nucleoside-diphosphate-sugar epimerase